MISSEFRIRDATTADVAEVVALVQSAYRGGSEGWTTEAHLIDGRRTDAGEVTALLAEPESFVLLALSHSGQIIGCCHLKRRDEVTAYFGMFAVWPELQGGGLGRAVLEAAEQRAVSEWSANEIQMTVLGQRSELIDWYLRRGYHRTGYSFAWPWHDEADRPKRDDLYFETLAKDL